MPGFSGDSVGARRSLLDATFDDAGPDGVPGETGHVVDIQLLHHTLSVFLDGLDTDAQFRRHLFVGGQAAKDSDNESLSREQRL